MKNLLKKSLIFESFTDEQIEKLLQTSIEKKFAQGDMIFFENDNAQGFYLVKEGKVKIFKMSGEGKEQILHIFGRGEPFGEAAVFSGNKFPANAQAMNKVTALFIARNIIIEIFENNPSTAMNIIGVLAKRLKEFTSLIENLTLKEIPQRLASYILNQEKIQGNKNFIELDFSKGQIAKIIGTTQETLSRTLTKLSDSGIIESDRKNIKIKNKDLLKKLSEGIIKI